MLKPLSLVRPLLEWFDRHARDLPWRRTRDPYAIWISEVMLQQTQVKTVIPYWERWMRELPDIPALASAPLDRVLKLWEGLGYYTRARHMHRAAQWMVENREGRFPETHEDVLALPGVGRYTAGAVCSIAFNQPTPILDGNVVRVLARVFGIRESPKQKETTDRLWRLATDLVRAAAESGSARKDGCPNEAHGLARNRRSKSEREDGSPRQSPKSTNACSRLNQALMEVGAILCAPRRPDCPHCPLRELCIAQKKGLVKEIPKAGPRPVLTRRHIAAFIIERRGRFLVRQRSEGGVNAGLWEFPNVDITTSKLEPATALATLLGASARRRSSLSPVNHSPLNQTLVLSPFCKVKHSITRYQITVDMFRAALGAGIKARRETGVWRSLVEIDQLPFTAAHRRIVAKLTEAPKPGGTPS